MKSKYAQKLNNINILLGIHIAFKLVIIFTLFIVLYTTIWIKEIYLTIIKTSVYIQIFIFLAVTMVMLAINNPKYFDICTGIINYFYLIVSILEFGIIICEIYYMIQNLKIFINVFHECPYYRTYEEISDSEYKRTCLYYITDYNNELPYKYICYYNSENEYYNNFCDGLICRKNNKDLINANIKCFGNVDKDSIHFNVDNEFYLKELELIHRYKSSNLYACFRKEKLIKDENIFNKKCPDSNPIKKMLIFIYSDIILHILIDFLFIYEFILLKKIKEIYSNLVLLQSVAHINILPNEDDINSEMNRNKQTFNTDNRDPQSQYTFNLQRESSQTIIIEPGFQNNNNKQENCNRLNMSTQNQLTQFENVVVDYNEDVDKSEDNKEKETIENNGVINRKAKIFKLQKRRANTNIDDKLNNNLNYMKEINKKNNAQRMVIVDIKKDEEYGINKINFFIKKKRRKRNTKTRNKNDNLNINANSNEELKTINTNINGNNKNDIKIIEEKRVQQIDINPRDKSGENESRINSVDNDSINAFKEAQKLKKTVSFPSIKRSNIKTIRNRFNQNNLDNDIKNKSNILKGNNNIINIDFKQEISENISNSQINKNNSEDKIMQNSLQNDVIKKINNNKYKDKQPNEEKSKKKNKTRNKSRELEKIKEYEKEITYENNTNSKDYINDSDNKSNTRENKNENNKQKLIDNIHIKSDFFLSDEEVENKNENKIINNQPENQSHEKTTIKLSCMDSTNITSSNKK